jgi:hypothetical protein
VVGKLLVRSADQKTGMPRGPAQALGEWALAVIDLVISGKFAGLCVLYIGNSYRQSMVGMGWRAAAFAAASVALVPALSGCVGLRDPFPTKTVTATAAPSTTTTPTTSQRDALRAWRDATLVPSQEVRDAAGKIVKAGETFDVTSMGIACQEDKDAAEQFQQHMPSPDSEVNAPLQKALSDYSAAATICTTAVENRNFDDFKQAATLVDEANTYMDDAMNILRADLGESSNSATPQSPSRSESHAAVDSEQDSVQELQRLASSDRPFVQANLADWWIPQLSSKNSTEPWTFDSEDGVTYDPARILREHQQLRQRYPGIVRLLWAGDWSAFSGPNFWITVVANPFPESADALAWCRSQGFDHDHCAATHLY